MFLFGYFSQGNLFEFVFSQPLQQAVVTSQASLASGGSDLTIIEVSKVGLGWAGQ